MRNQLLALRHKRVDLRKSLGLETLIIEDSGKKRLLRMSELYLIKASRYLQKIKPDVILAFKMLTAAIAMFVIFLVVFMLSYAVIPSSWMP